MAFSKFRVLIVYPNLCMTLTPSYAVGLFTALLRKEGFEVDIFDCTPYISEIEKANGGEALSVTRANKQLASRKFDPHSLFGDPKTDLEGDFARKIEEFSPNGIMFSTLVEDCWPQAQQLLEVLKTKFPQIPHLLGGVYAMMAPADVMKNTNVQVMGFSEGEEVVLEFFEALKSGGDTKHIKGTWSRMEDGSILKNPPRALRDINLNPIPDFSLFDDRRFYRPLGARIWKTLPIETYRGCPYTCTFCNSPTKNILAKEYGQGNYLRRRRIDLIREEVKHYIEEYGMEFLYINDDAFMARPKREIYEFVEMYKEFKIPFWFQTRFEDIDEDTLTALKDVGCFRISFGLEHGNEEFRRERLKRHVTNEKILERAAVVTKVGIPFTVNNIIGFPYETRDLMMETVMFNREIGTMDSMTTNVFVPYHGTVLRENALKEGWLDPEARTTSVIAESILNMPKPYLNGKEILGLQRAFPLYVRLDKSRYPLIRQVEDFTPEADKIFEQLSEEFYTKVYGIKEQDRQLTYQG